MKNYVSNSSRLWEELFSKWNSSSRLQSTMSQDHLEAFMLMTTERKLLKGLDGGDVTDHKPERSVLLCCLLTTWGRFSLVLLCLKKSVSDYRFVVKNSGTFKCHLFFLYSKDTCRSVGKYCLCGCVYLTLTRAFIMDIKSPKSMTSNQLRDAHARKIHLTDFSPGLVLYVLTIHGTISHITNT